MALTTDFFKQLVTNETKKLNLLCQQWTQVMDNETDITEEGFGQIRSTIGKTNLLINQRFKQFSGLIDDCQLKRGLKETKVEDLQGFWDMIYYQVQDLHQGFEHLIRLKDNKWCEPEMPHKEVKPIISKKPVKTAPKVDKSKPLVKSKIREQIQNMKNKKLEQNEVKNESFGEKENKKIENLIETDKKLHPISKSIDKCTESVPGVRPVLKRTPLLNAVKK